MGKGLKTGETGRAGSLSDYVKSEKAREAIRRRSRGWPGKTLVGFYRMIEKARELQRGDFNAFPRIKVREGIPEDFSGVAGYSFTAVLAGRRPGVARKLGSLTAGALVLFQRGTCAVR